MGLFKRKEKLEKMKFIYTINLKLALIHFIRKD